MTTKAKFVRAHVAATELAEVEEAADRFISLDAEARSYEQVLDRDQLAKQEAPWWPALRSQLAELRAKGHAVASRTRAELAERHASAQAELREAQGALRPIVN
jgi:TATA-binding protein-associated factor Taf7